MTIPTVHISFVSDFICPWCYIGKSRLERLKAKLEGEIQLDIETSPYLLYPGIPKGGAPKENFAKKARPGMGKLLREEASLEDVRLNYKLIEFIPRSLDAHRLVSLTTDSSVKWSLAKKLFLDYFEKGQDLENLDYLVECGESVGMAKVLLSEFLFTNLGEEEVLKQIDENKMAFITIVPTLRLDQWSDARHAYFKGRRCNTLCD